MNGDFIWRDAGRTVVFRRNGVAQAAQLLREHEFEPFELLSTPRALAGRHGAVGGGGRGARGRRRGRCPTSPPISWCGDLRRYAGKARGALVALGGGRTIDVAKAVASVTGARVAAIPTTMSGAEMTGIHRLPAGAESRVGALVRPALVIADPAAMTSQRGGGAAGELDERARARRRLALHARSPTRSRRWRRCAGRS